MFSYSPSTSACARLDASSEWVKWRWLHEICLPMARGSADSHPLFLNHVIYRRQILQGGRALGAADGERCGRRAGGGASCWQRDAVSTRSDGQRRRAEALVIATASCGGRACAARRSSISRRDGGERCGYRDGGDAPGMQCASIHCDIVAQRRDGGVLAVRLERRTGMCGGAVEPLVWRKAAALQPGGEDTPPSLEKSEQ